MYDLIIVGGGPAGLTATVYAVHKRLETLLVSPDLGGKANLRMQSAERGGYQTIDGEETVRRFSAQVDLMDFVREPDTVTAVEVAADVAEGDRFDVTTASGKVHRTRAVLVATGARPCRLGVPGEAELWRRGVSYSAVSHAPLYWDRDVAVVGGGALALRSAAELAMVAKHVYLVVPDAPPAGDVLGETLARAGNVTTLLGHRVLAVAGDPELSEITLCDPGGATRQLPVRGVFIELGIEPASEIVRDLVALDPEGHIAVDTRMATSRPGIFAAGDVTDAFGEQVLIAVGDGAKAALGIHEYLLRHPRRADEPLPAPPPPRPHQDW